MVPLHAGVSIRHYRKPLREDDRLWEKERGTRGAPASSLRIYIHTEQKKRVKKLGRSTLVETKEIL